MNALLKPDFLFRSMQEADLDAVLTIEPTIYSHPWTRGHFDDSLKSGHSAWVMMQDNQMIAYSVMIVVLDEAQLLNISVASQHQKQGLGRILLAHMIDQAHASNVLNMFLEVRPSNVSAIALYEKMGFTKTTVRRGYYPSKEGREDAILMGLTLSDWT